MNDELWALRSDVNALKIALAQLQGQLEEQEAEIAVLKRRQEIQRNRQDQAEIRFSS